jgi:hypothetical protein
MLDGLAIIEKVFKRPDFADGLVIIISFKFFLEALKRSVPKRTACSFLPACTQWANLTIRILRPTFCPLKPYCFGADCLCKLCIVLKMKRCGPPILLRWGTAIRLGSKVFEHGA